MEQGRATTLPGDYIHTFRKAFPNVKVKCGFHLLHASLPASCSAMISLRSTPQNQVKVVVLEIVMRHLTLAQLAGGGMLTGSCQLGCCSCCPRCMSSADMACAGHVIRGAPAYLRGTSMSCCWRRRRSRRRPLAAVRSLAFPSQHLTATAGRPSMLWIRMPGTLGFGPCASTYQRTLEFFALLWCAS